MCIILSDVIYSIAWDRKFTQETQCDYPTKFLPTFDFEVWRKFIGRVDDSAQGPFLLLQGDWEVHGLWSSWFWEKSAEGGPGGAPVNNMGNEIKRKTLLKKLPHKNNNQVCI